MTSGLLFTADSTAECLADKLSRATAARAVYTRRGLLRAAVGVAATAAAAGALAELRPLAALAGGLAGNQAGSVVLQWNKAALQAIRDTRPGPPMTARALAILHTCIYDAWAAYDHVAVGTQLGGKLRRPASERAQANGARRKAISYAAYRALADLYPSRVASFDSLMASLGYDPADTSTNTRTPSGIGNVAAQAVLAYRHKDGANQLGGYADTTGYAPVNTPDQIVDPNRWQPLRVPNGQGGFTIQKYIAPHWGGVWPFAMTAGAQFRPTGPALYPSGDYLTQAREILAISAGLTDTQKAIAEYWADGPASELPPGHWCLFAQLVCQRDGLALDDEVKLCFALTNALFDAGIAAWDAKRAYNYVRPVTAIRYLYAGKPVQAWGGPYQGTQTIDGGTWQPYQAATFVTPAFPEYVSGHSAFSAAAAEVLKRFTGSDRLGASYTQRAGTSRFEAGAVPKGDVTLSWATFTEAADQAGLSRRYGGIHFAQGDVVGRRIGRQVGARVWDKAQAYFTGAAGA